MVALLSQAWLDRQAELSQDLPERVGVDSVLQYEITGGADGDVVFHTEFSSGRIVGNRLGAADDAEFTLVIPRAEFERWLDGDADLQVGFMQGRVKASGNIGRMLSVLPMTTSEEWRAATAALAAETER